MNKVNGKNLLNSKRVLNRMFQNVALSVLVLILGFSFVSSDKASAASFSVPGDFATIQEAIDDPGTMNGDVINVGVGTHIENNIHITKELRIQGQGVGVTILDPSSISANVVQLYVDADNVILRDFTIQNAAQAIRFEMAGGTIDNTDIIRVSMVNNTSRGIELHNNTTVTNLLIDDCNFENTHHGIRLSSSGHLDTVRIDDSTFTNNVIGIYVANDGSVSTMANMSVRNCTFSNHTVGQGTAIFLEEAQNTVIQDSTFMDNRRDVMLFKWYQPSVPMSDVIIRRNIISGTTDSVFSVFNADNGGQTVFSNIRFIRNIVTTNDGSAVYAGAHRTGPPSLGGTGWDDVRVRNNCFNGITTAGNAVRFFIPEGIPPDDALGGAILHVVNNWWGSADLATITALMENPTITDYEPFRASDSCTAPFFAIQRVKPSLPGRTNSIEILNGTPNGDVAFFYGLAEGNSDASDYCEGSVLNLDEFFELGTVTADSSGNSLMNIEVPQNFQGRTAYIQAIDMDTCVESELTFARFESQQSNITHLPIVPGVSGALNTLSVTEAEPNGDVTFIWGYSEQAVTADNICSGLQAGILNPRILVTVPADELGNASVTPFVPHYFAGFTVVVQAVDLTSCLASNVVQETFDAF